MSYEGNDHHHTERQITNLRNECDFYFINDSFEWNMVCCIAQCKKTDLGDRVNTTTILSKSALLT
eukprot:11141687-Ditylum_brightwellii.AAC.1